MNIGYGHIGSAYAHEALTVGSTAVGPSSTVYDVQGTPGPNATILSVETAEVRYRIDGQDPTATTGHALQPGESIVLVGHARRLKLIRTGSTSATVRLTYLS